MWPDEGVFGPGMVQRLYLPPVGCVRNFSYVEYDGIRYGSHHHTSGRGYSYGYINDRYPVRVELILYIEFPGRPNLRTICVLIRRFQLPQIEARFPWDTW
jgi:hypothetical protein